MHKACGGSALRFLHLRSPDMAMLDPQLLDLLACPRCKGEIVASADGEWLICASCSVRYPVREGIPILLLGEAQPLPPSTDEPADMSG